MGRWSAGPRATDTVEVGGFGLCLLGMAAVLTAVVLDVPTWLGRLGLAAVAIGLLAFGGAVWIEGVRNGRGFLRSFGRAAKSVLGLSADLLP